MIRSALQQHWWTGSFTCAAKNSSTALRRDEAMNLFASVVVTTVLLCGEVSACAAASTWDWPIATPESQGMSSARIDAIKERLATEKTRAFLVVRNDHIIY